MHLRLISWFFIILNFMEYIGSQNASRGRRQRRMHPNVSQGCQGGCATCSDYNGCLSCKPKLFFVLERIGMKQIGVCLSSCPSGYYGTRYPDINKCTKCKADCDTCFNKNFCTKCKSGFYLHLGKCLDNCPEGLEANNHTMECVSIGEDLGDLRNIRADSISLRGSAAQNPASQEPEWFLLEAHSLLYKDNILTGLTQHVLQ